MTSPLVVTGNHSEIILFTSDGKENRVRREYNLMSNIPSVGCTRNNYMGLHPNSSQSPQIWGVLKIYFTPRKV